MNKEVILMPPEFLQSVSSSDLALTTEKWEKVCDLMLEYSEYVRRQEGKIREQLLREFNNGL